MSSPSPPSSSPAGAAERLEHRDRGVEDVLEAVRRWQERFVDWSSPRVARVGSSSTFRPTLRRIADRCPIDQILKHLNLADLYRLSQTNQQLYVYLRSPSEKREKSWEDAARRTSWLFGPGLSEGPGVSPLGLAHQLFGVHCQVSLLFSFAFSWPKFTDSFILSVLREIDTLCDSHTVPATRYPALCTLRREEMSSHPLPPFLSCSSVGADL